ncbi:hypothetical protein BDR05DRAFT_655732 [Suillus weaverae]|nr:hypothetical protein BDR05DRAFT_655732 [Suillus weaverae]
MAPATTQSSRLSTSIINRPHDAPTFNRILTHSLTYSCCCLACTVTFMTHFVTMVIFPTQLSALAGPISGYPVRETYLSPGSMAITIYFLPAIHPNLKSIHQCSFL